jgi:hypothetical protein
MVAKTGRKSIDKASDFHAEATKLAAARAILIQYGNTDLALKVKLVEDYLRRKHAAYLTAGMKGVDLVEEPS